MAINDFVSEDALETGPGLHEKKPVVPLKDTVVFPGTMVPLSVGRDKSLKALEHAISGDKRVLLLTQVDLSEEEPSGDGLFNIGTMANIMQHLKMPDGSSKILVEGLSRELIVAIDEDSSGMAATSQTLDSQPLQDPLVAEAMKRNLLRLFEQVVNQSRNLPGEAYVAALNMEDLERLGYVIATHLSLPVTEAQGLLNEPVVETRLRRLSLILERELAILEIEGGIQSQVREQMDKMQRDIYLREQARIIERELAGDEDGQTESEILLARLEAMSLPDDTHKHIAREIARLEKIPSMSPEVPMLRTYIDWLLEMPWDSLEGRSVNMRQAEKLLEKSHYGLDRVKERILEYLAVYKLTGHLRGPILCFVGPPGTGKTSIGRSIAEAMGRRFIRVSLGGMRDEAEIRGHRRTYIGAMPGRIVQALRQCGSRNPVFMMDEIDKVGADFRGDPSSALLEALDPEQNNSFSDNYLEVPFDLSDVLFITTANTLETISPALRDRMEVIPFYAYTDEEKMAIAEDYLIPQQIKDNGLKRSNIDISEGALLRIIEEYTRESGVRGLDREIGSLCRKVARRVAEEGRRTRVRLTAAAVPSYLGLPVFPPSRPDGKDMVGVATGLAWTEVGGETLSVEVSIIPGKGNISITGQVGDVMRESAQAALTYVRSRAAELGMAEAFEEERDIHIHIPAGAVPKDGPSAGVTMATAIASAASGIPVRGYLAMTGEITLRGRVLQVAGIKEKVLAAYRDGIKTIVMPEENMRDLDEVPSRIRRKMNFVKVHHMDGVLEAALLATQDGDGASPLLDNRAENDLEEH